MPDHDEPNKAEFTYREYTGMMAAAAQIYREFGIAKTLTHPEIDGKPTIVYIKNVIERHTHLTDKEAALRGLVQLLERWAFNTNNKDCVTECNCCGSGFGFHDKDCEIGLILMQTKEALKP